jgi:hypothetical protein
MSVTLPIQVFCHAPRDPIVSLKKDRDQQSQADFRGRFIVKGF